MNIEIKKANTKTPKIGNLLNKKNRYKILEYYYYKLIFTNKYTYVIHHKLTLEAERAGLKMNFKKLIKIKEKTNFKIYFYLTCIFRVSTSARMILGDLSLYMI